MQGSSVAEAASRIPTRLRPLCNWDDLVSLRPLPVRFALFPSRRVDRTLCPALVVRTDGVEVIRILDPEHKQPFFSLDSIFLLAGLSPLSGLMRFKLRREHGDYDLTLAGLEPREGLWSPWSTALAIARELDLFPALDPLFTCKHAWSLDERVDGFSHNWCVSSEQINPSNYSLSALLEHAFSTITLLPQRQQIRTLISMEQRAQASEATAPVSLHLGCPHDEHREDVLRKRVRLEQSLVRWAVRAYEQWLESYQELHDQSAWSPNSVEILLYLHTLVLATPDGVSSGSGDAHQLIINTDQDRTTVEELKAWSVRRQSQSKYDSNDHHVDEDQSSSTKASQPSAFEQEARACLHLVDHLSRLYFDQAVLCARLQFYQVRLAQDQLVSSSEQHTAAAVTKAEHKASNDATPSPIDRKYSMDIDTQLVRLVASAKRTEEAIGMLARQGQSDRRGQYNTAFDILTNQSIPWHSAVALLVGLVLGSMLMT